MELRQPDEKLVAFNSLVDRLGAEGLSMEVVLQAAEVQQDTADEGIVLPLDPGENGVGAVVDVSDEEVKFQIGGLGPYTMTLAEVRGLIVPPNNDSSW